MRVVVAINDHGLGHLTRMAAVLNELAALHPQVEPWICTGFARERIAAEIAMPFEYRYAPYEPGTAQRGGFELDVDETRRQQRRFHAERRERWDAETAFLRSAAPVAVLSDVAALPLAVAANLEIRAIGLGNFTWDWLLEPVLSDRRDAAILESLRADYARADLFLRYPLGPDVRPGRRCEEAPLVSRPARLSRERVLKGLGIEPDAKRRTVLVCPGGWDASDWQPIRVTDSDDFGFACVGDLPVETSGLCLHLPHQLPEPIRFPDLVQAVDVVLSKPGYGIASECLRHGTPLVCIERPGFREAPVLKRALRSLGPCAEMGLEDFFAGRWEPALRAALESTTPWATLPRGGARQVATRIAAELGVG